MDHQLEFAYIGLEVSDPGALGSLLTDVVGLLPGETATDGSTTFRNDGRTRRVLVQEGPLDDCSVLAFEAVDDRAFEETAARLEAAGFPLTEGDDEETTARDVTRLLHTESPWHLRFELVQGLAAAGTPFASALARSGFQTDGVGAGHTAVAVTSFEDSERFLLDGLNMVQSDWIETELMEGIELEVRFYHCNERHHSIAVAKLPLDLGKSLHHLQVEVNDRDDVGFAFDRAWSSGCDFANGLGLHDNEGAFSFYITSPAGFLVEVGFGTKKVYTPWDGNRRYDSISRWGHQPIPRS
ncbi:MAG: VOC family protein [Acidimicrobiales bacterium]